MKSLNVMMKPASSLCNMRCKYCFYADVSSRREIISCGIMSPETRDALLSRVETYLDNGDHVQFTFQGGEPTLAGLSFFRDFVSNVKKWKKDIRVSYALQTNGMLIDEEWCAFLNENAFLVGVSFDILPDCHDEVRTDANENGTYKRILDSIHLFDRYKVEYNVLCTLTNTIARHPQQVWNRLVQSGIQYVQFTPCLGELDEQEPSPYALSPKRFASFYIQMFGFWYDAYTKGKFISIKLFDDILNLMVLGRPTSCGMNGTCQPQLVVEADGSVYPCDFYCLDEYKIGNIKERSLAELLNDPCVGDFVNRPHNQPNLCNGCPYRAFCGGNCKRMQKEICCAGADKYCGYFDLLNNCRAKFINIANEIVYSKRRGR